MSDESHWGVCSAAERVQRGDATAAELIAQTLARLEVTEPLIHAYERVDTAGALLAARNVDEKKPRAAGHLPLAGVALAVKDTIETAGMVTEAGSRLLAGHVPTEDATSVRLLRQAGATLIGKHTTNEFASAQDMPPTRNAWDLERYPGASSVGAGASIAARSSLIALGTDTGGSIRVPAALNGVVGLKPSFGRISQLGIIPGPATLGHIAYCTPLVADAALVLETLARFDPDDGTMVPAAAGNYVESLEDRGRFRVGVPDEFFGPELDPAVGDAIDAALDALGATGAELVRLSIPSLRLAREVIFTIDLAEAAEAHRDWLRERAAEYRPETRLLLELGALIPAMHVEVAWRGRALICGEVRDAFDRERLDVIAGPTVPCTAPRLADFEPARDLGRLVAYTSVANATGQPAISMPCGFVEDLPVGLQLIGRPFHEERLLSVAAAFETTTPWHAQPPPALASVPPASAQPL